MITCDLKALSTIDLLRHFAEILDELKERRVLRTRNTPVRDYAEWLVSQELELSLGLSSKSSCGDTDTNSKRFEIKKGDKPEQAFWK